MFGLGSTELIIIGVIAVLLFGKRLPEVARSLGKSMTEFKRGMNDLHQEVHTSSSPQRAVANYNAIDDRDEPTAPKFEPPPSEPQAEEHPV